jgi:hypothetical protein
MGQKRSSKKAEKEAQSSANDWSPSKCSESSLLRLVSDGLLQSQNLIHWRVPLEDQHPQENDNEIVSFLHFAERGLAFPTSSFFRGLLYFYGLELHHLNPNSVCHISIFIHLCEAFLGIEPHFDLFRFLFRVKPQPTSDNPSVIGGAGIQLRQNAGDKYLAYKFPSNIPGWKSQWFYIVNQSPPLPKKSGNPPVLRAEWIMDAPSANMDQVEELLALIVVLKAEGVTGASVLYSFFKRRIQPIQHRVRLGFEYQGTEDPSRLCAEEISDAAALGRVKRVLLDVDAVPYVPKLFSAQNPPNPVSLRVLELWKNAFHILA